MGLVSPTQVSDGTTADASDINTPVNQIAAVINGNIDNSNIAAAAAIDGSKLAANSIDIGAKASVFDGWIAVSDTWTYASATTVTVPSDATTKYSVGDKVKFTNSGAKYFYITAVGATTLTLNGGTDYTVANAAITVPYYSKAATPIGFPQYFNYAPTLANITETSGTKTANFTMVGKTISFKVRFIMGASSAVTGSPTVTLPTTATSFFLANQGGTIGQATLVDTGVKDYTAALRISSTTVASVLVIGASGLNTAISSTVPFTWGTSDEFAITGSYETA